MSAKLSDVLKAEDGEIKPRKSWEEVRLEVFYGFSPRLNRIEMKRQKIDIDDVDENWKVIELRTTA